MVIPVEKIIQWIQSPNANEEIIRWILQNLTGWVAWKNRAKTTLTGLDDPGLYFIADRLPGKTDILSCSVVCVGQTSRTLADRLDEFDSTASKGKELHGPGGRHRERGGSASDGVYVSILPLKLEQPLRHVLPSFLEGVVHYYYKKTNGDLPPDNRHSKNENEFGIKARPERAKGG